MLVSLSIRLYPINVKTAEPIGPKFCVAPPGTPGKVYELSKSKIIVFKICVFVKNFKNFKIRESFFVKSGNLHKENMFTKDGREAP